MHTRYDLVRAVMEGVTFSLRDCAEILRGMGVQSDVILACGGGGSSAFWRQIMADILGCPVATTISKEGPALGVAILAGVGAGLYPSVPEACRKIVGVKLLLRHLLQNMWLNMINSMKSTVACILH